MQFVPLSKEEQEEENKKYSFIPLESANASSEEPGLIERAINFFKPAPAEPSAPAKEKSGSGFMDSMPAAPIRALGMAGADAGPLFKDKPAALTPGAGVMANYKEPATSLVSPEFVAKVREEFRNVAPEYRRHVLTQMAEGEGFYARAAQQILADVKKEDATLAREGIMNRDLIELMIKSEPGKPAPRRLGNEPAPTQRVAFPDMSMTLDDMVAPLSEKDRTPRRLRRDQITRGVVEAETGPQGIVDRAREDDKRRDRTEREYYADLGVALEQGGILIRQVVANSIDPSSEWAKELNEKAKQAQEKLTPQKQYQAQQLAATLAEDPSEMGKFVTMLAELVTNPSVAVEEIVRQGPLLGVMVASSYVGGAAGLATAKGAMAVAPRVALADAISGGGVVAAAKGAGASIASRAAAAVAGGGDAAGQVYQELTSKKLRAAMENSPDVKRLVGEGKTVDEAVNEVALAKARFAQGIAAPLSAIFGAAGFESILARKIGGQKIKESATQAFTKELVTEQADELGTQFASNLAVKQIDPTKSLTDEFGQTAATTLVTTLPFAGASAAAARSDKNNNPALDKTATWLLEPSTYDTTIPSYVNPRDTVNRESPAPREEVAPPPGEWTPESFAAAVSTGTPMDSPEDRQYYQNNAQAIEAELQRLAAGGNRTPDTSFTPPDSPTAQAGLAPIIVPGGEERREAQPTTAEEVTARAQQRLAELEQISRGTPEKTYINPFSNRPQVISATPGRMFTQAEKEEYDALRANIDNPEALAKREGSYIGTPAAINPETESAFGLDKLRMGGGANAGASGSTGAAPAVRGDAGSDQRSGRLDTAGSFDVGTAGRLNGDVAGVPAGALGADLAAGAAAVQPAAGVTPQGHNNDVPTEQWFGRKGDGYTTEADAAQAMPGRQRMFPALEWRVEQMPSGKYRIAGYTLETTNGAQAPQAQQAEAQGQEAPAAVASARQSDLSLPQPPLSDAVVSGLGSNPQSASVRLAVQQKLNDWGAREKQQAPQLGTPDSDAETTVTVLGNVLGEALGIGRGKTIAYSEPGGQNGFAFSGYTFVNTAPDTDITAPRTTGHEVHHFIEKVAEADTAAGRTNTPAQKYVEQTNAIFDDMRESGRRAYLENFLHQKELDALYNPKTGKGDKTVREARLQELINAPKTRSEMTADFIGNRMTDRNFLIDLAKADPKGFEGFVRKWLAVIDNLIAKLRGSPTQSRKESALVDTYVRDFNKAKMIARDALIEFRKGNLGAAQQQTTQSEAPVMSEREAEAKDKTSRVGSVETHVLQAERGQRTEGKVGRLSVEEKSIIRSGTRETKGASAAELEERARINKRSHPATDGWAPLKLTGLKVNEDNGKVELQYQVVPYQFNVGADGKLLEPGTQEYKARVAVLAQNMLREVRSIYERAQAGDKAAANILAQSGWYKEMRTRLRQEFGGLGDLFADLLGATSPNTPVRTNWDNSVEALRLATQGQFDELLPQWEAFFSRLEETETRFRAFFDDMLDKGLTKADIKRTSEYQWLLERVREAREFPDGLLPRKANGKKFGFNGYNVARAMVDLWRVVKNADPDIARGGTAPKAINFSGNLIGFRARATIDVWAARMLQRLAGGARIPSMAEGGVSGEALESGRNTLQFGFGQDVFSEAVRLIRSDAQLSQDPVLASINDDDLQALVWFIEKEVWTKGNWTSAAGEGGSFEFEADLAGVADRERVAELRQEADSSVASTEQERAKATSDIAAITAKMQSYPGIVEANATLQRNAGLITESKAAAKGQKLTNDQKERIRLENAAAREQIKKAKQTQGYKKLQSQLNKARNVLKKPTQEQRREMRAAAVAELGRMAKTVDRYALGLSIQKGAEQGVEPTPPTDAEMAQLADDIVQSVVDGDNGATVIAVKAISTEGRYGAPERALDLEAIVNEKFDARPLAIATFTAAEKGQQDAAFVARVVRPDETFDPLLHRPGIEIYFRDMNQAREAARIMAGTLETRVGKPLDVGPGYFAVGGYTVIVDGRPTAEAKAGKMGKPVGMRVIYMPEFEARYGIDPRLADATENNIGDIVNERANDLARFSDEILRNFSGVSFAGRFNYEVDTRFAGEYAGAINAYSSGTTAEGTSLGRGKPWQGRSVRESVAAAVGRLPLDASEPGATVPRRNDSDAPGFSRRQEQVNLPDRADFTQLAYQGYEKAEVPKVQAARKLEGLLAKFDEGKLTRAEFELQVRLLSGRMANASAVKAANKLLFTRERGADIVREKLIAARRRGEVDFDLTQFALWALDQNPLMAEGLGVSVRQQPESERDTAGDYNPASQIMRIFKGGSGVANPDTGVHEILHHTERMMPPEVQDGIRKEWAASYAKALAKATGAQREALALMPDAMAGSFAAQAELRSAFRDGTLDVETHYQLTNPSEYWAVNATDILRRRFDAGSWIGKAKQWLTEMLEKVKGILGARSDAAVLKGLKAVLEGDGSRLSERMLIDAATYSQRRVTDDQLRQTNEAQRKGVGLDVVPEEMFGRKANPGIEHGGEFQYAAEHIGDLVHRLSFRDVQGGGVSYGIDAAAAKASRSYDFKDMLPQVRRNYAYFRDERGYKGSEEDFVNDFTAAARRYADAYRKVPVHTEFQRLGRDAAIALGELDFEVAKKTLADLAQRLNKKNAKQKYFEPIESSDVRMSARQTSPLGFYSALADGVDQLKASALPVVGWKDAIKGMVNKGQVKADEVQWTGINEWLDLQQGRVTKAQVQEYLNANGVQVEETVLGEQQGDAAERKLAIEGLRENGVLNPTEAQINDYLNEYGYDLGDARSGKPFGAPKFEDRGPRGGTNYREVLLTLPAANDGGPRNYIEGIGRITRDDPRATQGPAFRSSHWDQPNVVAHLRVDDRTDADGKRVLFIREIQSDWGQKGRDEGFHDPSIEARVRSEMEAAKNAHRYFLASMKAKYGGEGLQYARQMTAEEKDEARRLSNESERIRQESNLDRSAPPRAPFVTKTDAWVSLALKRAVIMAAQEGYDRVAIINGEQAADMFDLRKQVDKVTAQKNYDGTYTIGVFEKGETSERIINGSTKESELAELIGKELADKIRQRTADSIGVHEFVADDLKVGGEGMRGFYDGIVPKVAKEVVKKLGGQVGQVSLGSKYKIVRTKVGQRATFDVIDNSAKGEHGEPVFTAYSQDEAEQWVRNNPQTMQQFGFDITPAMRAKVEEGVPMFSGRQMGINVRNDGDNRYADMIVDGDKTMESRDTDSLRPYVGQTVGVVRTGEGAAKLIGSVKVGEPVKVGQRKFRELESQHLVPAGSAYDIKLGGVKFLYPLTEAKRFDEERPVNSMGIVSREVQFSQRQGGRRSTKEVGRIFNEMVKTAEDDLTEVLYNWNGAELNEDKEKIILFPGRDGFYSRGQDGGKVTVSKAEFLDWLASDAPLNPQEFGNAPEWKQQIENLRRIAGMQSASDESQDVPQLSARQRDSWFIGRDELGRPTFGAGAKAYRIVADIANNLLDKPPALIGSLKPIDPNLGRAMRKMKIEVDRARRLTADVAGRLGQMNEADRELISDVIEGELKRGVKPAKRVLEVAASMQSIMSEQTTELVRLGMMDQDSASRWDGKYLPRFYESKLLDDAKDWAKAVRNLLGRPKVMQGIGGSSLKARGLFETVPVADLEEWVANGWEERDPTFDPTRDTEIQVWRDYTREERENMGEIRDAMFRFVMGYMRSQKDIALGRLYENLAGTVASRTEKPGYVQVPRTNVEDTLARRYGKLAGKWVPREVLDHLSAHDDTDNAALALYKKGLSMWKENKTVLNPVAHGNNVLSNLTAAHFAGVSYWDLHKYMGTVRDLVMKDPMVQEGIEAGLFGGTYSQADLVEMLPPELKALAAKTESTAQKSVDGVWNAMALFMRKPLGKAYEAEDLFFRYLIYRDARGRGLNSEDAVEYAQKYVFTYDDLPKGARNVRDYFIPFFPWTYKAIPMIAHTAAHYPWRLAAPGGAVFAANAAMYAIAYAASEGGDEPWWEVMKRYVTDSKFRERVQAMEEEERKNLAPWQKGLSIFLTPKTVRLGTDELTNLPLFMDISRVFPGGDMADFENNTGGWPLPAWLTPNNPILTSFAAFMINRDPFTGKDLVNANLDTVGEKAAKWGDYAWRQFSPAIAPFSYHFDRLMNALASETDKTIDLGFVEYTGIDKMGQPVQGKHAVPHTVGIKIKPVDLEVSEQIDKNKREALIRDLDKEIRSITRLAAKQYYSDARADSLADKAREKRQRLQEGLTVDGKEKK